MASDAEGMCSEQISIRFPFYIDTLNVFDTVTCGLQSTKLHFLLCNFHKVTVVNQVKCREFDGFFMWKTWMMFWLVCFHLLRKITRITAYYICATSVS